jgi:hypothetical protein
MVNRVLPCLALASLSACTGSRGRVLWEERDASVETVRMDAAPAGPTDAGVVFITLSGETPTEFHGSEEAEVHLDLCPENQALIGYRGTLQTDVFVSVDSSVPVIGSLEGVCATLAVEPSGRVSTSQAGALPRRGLAEAEPWEQRCAEDEIIVGFSGRSGVALDSVSFTCSPWTVLADAGVLALEQGALHALDAAGGPGGNAFDDRCPDGQLARGTSVYSGSWVDSAALICGMPNVIRE